MASASEESCAPTGEFRVGIRWSCGVIGVHFRHEKPSDHDRPLSREELRNRYYGTKDPVVEKMLERFRNMPEEELFADLLREERGGDEPEREERDIDMAQQQDEGEESSGDNGGNDGDDEDDGEGE